MSVTDKVKTHLVALRKLAYIDQELSCVWYKNKTTVFVYIV